MCPSILDTLEKTTQQGSFSRDHRKACVKSPYRMLTIGEGWISFVAFSAPFLAIEEGAG